MAAEGRGCRHYIGVHCFERLMNAVPAAVGGWCSSMYFPKVVFIEDFRVGVLHKILLILSVAYVITSFVSMREWNSISSPTGAVTAWIVEAGESQAYRDARATDYSSAFCDPIQNDAYDYSYANQESFTYTNVTCKEVPRLDRFKKQSSTEATTLAIRTFMEDSVVALRTVSGSQFGANCSLACAAQSCPTNHGLSGTYASSANEQMSNSSCSCSCSKKENYFDRTNFQFTIQHDELITFR